MVTNQRVVIGFVSGASVGALFGYQLAIKKLRLAYDQAIEAELQKTREYFQTARKEAYGDPDAANSAEATDPELALAKKILEDDQDEDTVTLEAAKEMLLDYGGDSPLSKPVVTEEWVNQGKGMNVASPIVTPEQGLVADAKTEENAQEGETEMAEGPFMISEDAFMAGELDYDQVTVTWYRGDEVLADEQDQPVERVEKLVGRKNLDRFGDGTIEDPNIIYVRCPEYSMDVEVALSEGKYAKEVMGIGE